MKMLEDYSRHWTIESRTWSQDDPITTHYSKEREKLTNKIKLVSYLPRNSNRFARVWFYLRTLLLSLLLVQYTQSTYRVHTGYIQGTYRVHTEYIQGIYRVHTGYTQGSLLLQSIIIFRRIVEEWGVALLHYLGMSKSYATVYIRRLSKTTRKDYRLSVDCLRQPSK